MNYRIVFEYADAMSNWQWRKQEGTFYGRTMNEAISKCKDVYGLGYDCEYRIVLVEIVK